MFNASFQVAGMDEIIIPVSCVEHGRWAYRSRTFRHGQKMMHASLRRSSQWEVKDSLRQGRGHRPNQGRIWDDIAEKSARMEAPSATGAMSDMFEQYEDKLADYLKAFRMTECQVGAVFVINSQIVGLESFHYYDTLGRFHSKLVKSYALDAIDWLSEDNPQPVPAAKIHQFLESISNSQGEKHQEIGLGKNIRLESPSVSGAALVESDRVLHLSAFKKEKEADSQGLGYQRYSRRRRFRHE